MEIQRISSTVENQPTTTTDQKSSSFGAVLSPIPPHRSLELLKGPKEKLSRLSIERMQAGKPIRVLVKNSSDTVKENGEVEDVGGKPSAASFRNNRTSSSSITDQQPSVGNNRKRGNRGESLSATVAQPITGSGEKTNRSGKGKPNFSKSRKPKYDVVHLIDLAPELGNAGNRKQRDSQPKKAANKQEVSGQTKKDTRGPDRSYNQPSNLKPRQAPQRSLKQNPAANKKSTSDNPHPVLSMDDFPQLPVSEKSEARLNPLARPWTQHGHIPVPSNIAETKNSILPSKSNSKETQKNRSGTADSRSGKLQNLGNKSVTNEQIKKKDHTVKTETQQRAPEKHASSGKMKGSKTTPSSTAAVSLSDMFAAKQRAPVSNEDHTGGDALQLVRLMMEGKVATSHRGHGHRQRIGPRKKKFSTLKKHVLKERLLKWQLQNASKVPEKTAQVQGEESGGVAPTKENSTATTICILGFAEPDLIEDEDEYEELVRNLEDMAKEIGQYRTIFIPRQNLQIQVSSPMESPQHPAFVRFTDVREAEAALSCWNGLTMGGKPLLVDRVTHISGGDEDAGASSEDSSKWEKDCEDWYTRGSLPPLKEEASSIAQVLLQDVLTEDDLDDEDCLEESLEDIRKMAEQHGLVNEIRADRASKSVTIIFDPSASGADTARKAADNFGKTILGGSSIIARLQQPNERSSILLKNVFSEEDLDDEDCMEESLADLRELASKYGHVASIEPVENTADAMVNFLGPEKVAQAARSGFQGMVIGGAEVAAVVLGVNEGGTDVPADNMSLLESAGTTEYKDEPSSDSSPTPPSQLFSGEKLIGERWAECKRASKIPNGSNPRRYATLVDDETTKPLLVELLSELMRLQKRAVEEDKNTKAKRRLVLGLREVARGIRTKKVKMVVMANNLDEYGAIDDKLQEILDLAYHESIPVFFEFSKRGLGKAIGKTIKIAVVG